MKCDRCNGTGVIYTMNSGDTKARATPSPCPNCDHGNLQLRLDHNFQPVVDDERPGLPEAKWKQLTPEQYVEERFTKVNPILAELPFAPGSVPVSKVTPLKMEPPTAVQDRDAVIAQVHAEFAKAGLRIVPVEDIKQAVRAIEDLRDDIKYEFGVNSATRCDKTIQALCALLPKE